jgi:hypothetical protein
MFEFELVLHKNIMYPTRKLFASTSHQGQTTSHGFAEICYRFAGDATDCLQQVYNKSPARCIDIPATKS